MQHEKSGLPDTSYQGDFPLLDAEAESEISWDVLTRVFSDASATALETYNEKSRLKIKKVAQGKKLFLIYQKRKTKKEQLKPNLTKELRGILGPMAEELINSPFFDKQSFLYNALRERLANRAGLRHCFNAKYQSTAEWLPNAENQRGFSRSEQRGLSL